MSVRYEEFVNDRDITMVLVQVACAILRSPFIKKASLPSPLRSQIL